LAAFPEQAGLRLADAAERAGEVLEVAERDDAVEGEHGGRGVPARLVAGLRVGSAGGRNRVGDPLDAQRAGGEQRDPLFRHQSGEADPGPVDRLDVLDAARRARTVAAVAELDGGVALVVAAQ